ncbi:MAG: sugar phosphate isomerase/epimerase [Gallionellaceae bacterium]|nr:sugar phosphate isomerase/epimerase [Gallionellaceae bacterium]
MSSRIGFMQGRLSPLIDGRIQCFPWPYWREEFPQAQQLGIRLMEWTLDQERLYENPLMTSEGQAEIRALCGKHGLAIPSLTGDCFMQAPFWKATGAERIALERDFIAVAQASVAVGITMMVVPLVDNGRLENAEQEDTLIAFLGEQTGFLAEHRLQVVFESDFGPEELARFIARLDPALFGINYDIGNSAALGFDPAAEIAAYGARIVNVHVKDRVLGGTTVPLGTGNADFETVFAHLARIGYRGNCIMQTARAGDGDHAAALSRYRDMIKGWLSRYPAHAA